MMRRFDRGVQNDEKFVQIDRTNSSHFQKGQDTKEIDFRHHFALSKGPTNSNAVHKADNMVGGMLAKGSILANDRVKNIIVLLRNNATLRPSKGHLVKADDTLVLTTHLENFSKH
eukprot:g24072.t1